MATSTNRVAKTIKLFRPCFTALCVLLKMRSGIVEAWNALKNRRKISIAIFSLTFFGICGCDPGIEKGELQGMTNLTSRVQSSFEKTKAVCFGRFVVDVPESSKVVWGKIAVPYDLEIYPNGVGEVEKEAKNFIDDLKNETAIYHGKVPLLLSVENVLEPKGKIVVGYDGFEAINGIKVKAYFDIAKNGIVISARAFMDEKDEVLSDLLSIARRLQFRVNNEVPVGPGNCIEHAFLSDKKNPSKDDLLEHIRIGFRLKDFPDAHFSIYVAPAGDKPNEDSLQSQMKETKDSMASIDEKLVLARTNFFREGERNIYEWKTGYEVLMRSPDEEGVFSHHDFHLRFVGVTHDPYKPYVDIKFVTGVANNAAGATRASLTDEEAIAVWDKITSSIRVRPTVDKAVKTSNTNQAKLHPLGELAATGRTCPQTGWWEASEEDNIAGDRRLHIQTGELMPHAMSRGNPTLWQKFKGEQPVYRTATVWKLVSYDEGPSDAKVVAAAPASGQLPSAGASIVKTASDASEGKDGDNVLPEQKG